MGQPYYWPSLDSAKSSDIRLTRLQHKLKWPMIHQGQPPLSSFFGLVRLQHVNVAQVCFPPTLVCEWHTQSKIFYSSQHRGWKNEQWEQDQVQEAKPIPDLQVEIGTAPLFHQTACRAALRWTRKELFFHSFQRAADIVIKYQSCWVKPQTLLLNTADIKKNKRHPFIPLIHCLMAVFPENWLKGLMPTFKGHLVIQDGMYWTWSEIHKFEVELECPPIMHDSWKSKGWKELK